jgi:hypothetical protein
MENSSVKFHLKSTGLDLIAMVRFDDQVLYHDNVREQGIDIYHEFNDEQHQSHCLEIELSNKLAAHTILDAEGNIIKDVLLQVSDFSIDGIELRHLFFDRCVYTHDCNGTAALDEHKFWGSMGCNGVVTFKFTSPVYLWLLENM